MSVPSPAFSLCFFFFFNDTATTEIYTLSLHDALPISLPVGASAAGASCPSNRQPMAEANAYRRFSLAEPCVRIRSDRKSTRLNSSHANISYAVFCLKKKKKKMQPGEDE